MSESDVLRNFDKLVSISAHEIGLNNKLKSVYSSKIWSNNEYIELRNLFKQRVDDRGKEYTINKINYAINDNQLLYRSNDGEDRNDFFITQNLTNHDKDIFQSTKIIFILIDEEFISGDETKELLNNLADDVQKLIHTVTNDTEIKVSLVIRQSGNNQSIYEIYSSKHPKTEEDDLDPKTYAPILLLELSDFESFTRRLASSLNEQSGFDSAPRYTGTMLFTNFEQNQCNEETIDFRKGISDQSIILVDDDFKSLVKADKLNIIKDKKLDFFINYMLLLTRVIISSNNQDHQNQFNSQVNIASRISTTSHLYLVNNKKIRCKHLEIRSEKRQIIPSLEQTIYIELNSESFPNQNSVFPTNRLFDVYNEMLKGVSQFNSQNYLRGFERFYSPYWELLKDLVEPFENLKNRYNTATSGKNCDNVNQVVNDLILQIKDNNNKAYFSSIKETLTYSELSKVLEVLHGFHNYTNALSNIKQIFPPYYGYKKDYVMKPLYHFRNQLAHLGTLRYRSENDEGKELKGKVSKLEVYDERGWDLYGFGMFCMQKEVINAFKDLTSLLTQREMDEEYQGISESTRRVLCRLLGFSEGSI